MIKNDFKPEKFILGGPLQFDPIELLDWTRWRLRIFSDFDLAKELKTSPSVISKIRRGHKVMGAGILLRILDLTDVRLKELPALINRSKIHWK
jgi:hypothetical protein